jgi:hypothetical protein
LKLIDELTLQTITIVNVIFGYVAKIIDRCRSIDIYADTVTVSASLQFFAQKKREYEDKGNW